jgi:hypothetical protein
VRERTDELDVETLSRREARQQLSFGRLLRLYLDPCALLKTVTRGAPGARDEALRYNCRQRRVLLAYARRWSLLGLACLVLDYPLCALASAAPLLLVPIVGLDLVFSGALCLAFFSLALYLLLGLEQRRR